jgi:hypothetical protein
MDPQGGAVGEVDVIAVAGSPDPGKAPELPQLVGTGLGVGGFGPASQTKTATFAILRFSAVGPVAVSVTPTPLGTLRFGERFPSVDVLPAARR